MVSNGAIVLKLVVDELGVLTNWNRKEVVKKRKAIRKYLDKSVSDELVSKILETVNLAPSAGNLQAFKILIIKTKSVFDKASVYSIQIFLSFNSVVSP